MAREKSPIEQLAELEDRLGRDGPLPSGLVLRGGEAYFRERGLRATIAAAKRRQWEICVHDVDDREFQAASLHADLASGAMFASARCVVVRGAEKLAKARSGETLVKAARAFLERREGQLVLASSGLRADNPLVKAVLAAEGSVLHCRELYADPAPWDRSQDPRDTELVRWILSRSRELALQLTAEQAVLLVAASGNDLSALENQLLCIQGGGSRKLFDLIASDAPGSPFKVAEDLARGAAPAALFGLETLFQNGMQPDEGAREVRPETILPVLFASLRRQVRQGWAGAAALQRGASPEEAAGEAGVTPNPLARRAFGGVLAARGELEQRAMLADVLRLERAQRSGGVLDVNELALFALRWRARRAARMRT